MSDILPKSSAVKKAVKWISEQLESRQLKEPGKFIDEAVFRFDLSPKDAEFLINFYRNRKEFSS